MHIHAPMPVEEKFFEEALDYFKDKTIEYKCVETSCCQKWVWVKKCSLNVSYYEWYGVYYTFKCKKCSDIKYVGDKIVFL